MATAFNHFDTVYPIITRSATMRTEDVVAGLVTALDLLESYAMWLDSEDTDNVAFDARRMGVTLAGQLWLLQRVEARGECADEAAGILNEIIWEAVRFLEENCPEGWTYGVNEYDPAEAGFWPASYFED